MRLHGKTAIDTGTFTSPPFGTYSVPDDPTLLLRRAMEREERSAREEERRQSSDTKVRERIALARERMALARKQLGSLRSQRNRGISFSFKRLHRRRRAFPRTVADPSEEQWYLDPVDPGRRESAWLPALPAALLPLRKALRRRAAKARGPPTFDWDADLVPLDLVASPSAARSGNPREGGSALERGAAIYDGSGDASEGGKARATRLGKAWLWMPRNPFAARGMAAPAEEDDAEGLAPKPPVRRVWPSPFSMMTWNWGGRRQA